MVEVSWMIKSVNKALVLDDDDAACVGDGCEAVKWTSDQGDHWLLTLPTRSLRIAIFTYRILLSSSYLRACLHHRSMSQ